MEKVIFDCDNTMGIKDYPMDDALALFYLLGNRDKVDVLGITTTFGNSSVRDVYKATTELINSLSLNIPVKRGSESFENPISEAAEYIVKTINEDPLKVSIVAVGSMTNLYGAFLLDNTIFEKVKEIIIMGGITEDLIVHGGVLNELNLSCNVEAATCVLKNSKNLSIITGNNCLDAYLPREEFIEKLSSESSKGGNYILDKCSYRFDYKVKAYGADGSYCWDVVATAYLLYKHLFKDEHSNIVISKENFKTGYLERGESMIAVNIPKIVKIDEFKENIYNRWNNFL